MIDIELVRAVAADPSSVALVLAGPAARELWPQRSQRLVDVVGPQRPALAVVVAPPTRSSVGFAASVSVHTGDDTIATGRLAIAPHLDGDGCDVRLTLSADPEFASTLRRDTARYLDNVARLSRERSSAA